MLHTSTEELSIFPRVFSPDPTCGSEPPDKASDQPPRGGKVKPQTQPDSPASRENGIKPPMGTDALERPALIPIDSEQQGESS